MQCGFPALPVEGHARGAKFDVCDDQVSPTTLISTYEVSLTFETSAIADGLLVSVLSISPRSLVLSELIDIPLFHRLGLTEVDRRPSNRFASRKPG